MSLRNARRVESGSEGHRPRRPVKPLRLAAWSVALALQACTFSPAGVSDDGSTDVGPTDDTGIPDPPDGGVDPNLDGGDDPFDAGFVANAQLEVRVSGGAGQVSGASGGRLSVRFGPPVVSTSTAGLRGASGSRLRIGTPGESP